MQRYIVKRLFQTIITLFVLSMAIFLMGRLSGDPCDLLLPDEAEATEFELCAEQLGLNKPVYVQYWIWVKGAVRGDFGRAYVSGKPVIELILQRFPNSIKLGIASMIFTTIVSLPLGLIAAVKKDTWIDTVTKTLAVLGQSLPSFWLGIMLVWVLAVQFRLLPVAGIGGPKYYIMPVLTMGWWTVAAQARLLRSSMLEVLDSEYVKLARIKGVSEFTVIYKHAFRNALIPMVSFMGLHFAHVISMAMIAEVVFAWPGLGRLLYDAIKYRDFPIVQAVILVMTTVTVVVNLGVDLLYAYIDPRIRYN
jgi:peptide/nickel transport system permease protein